MHLSFADTACLKKAALITPHQIRPLIYSSQSDFSRLIMVEQYGFLQICGLPLLI